MDLPRSVAIDRFASFPSRYFVGSRRGRAAPHRTGGVELPRYSSASVRATLPRALRFSRAIELPRAGLLARARTAQLLERLLCGQRRPARLPLAILAMEVVPKWCSSIASTWAALSMPVSLARAVELPGCSSACGVSSVALHVQDGVDILEARYFRRP